MNLIRKEPGPANGALENLKRQPVTIGLLVSLVVGGVVSGSWLVDFVERTEVKAKAAAADVVGHHNGSTKSHGDTAVRPAQLIAVRGDVRVIKTTVETNAASIKRIEDKQDRLLRAVSRLRGRRVQ